MDEALRQKRLAELRVTPRYSEKLDDPWQYTQGLMDLLEETKPSTVLTIGAAKGVSTEVFLLYCDRVTVVDPWPPDYPPFRERFLERTKPYADRLTAVRGYSPAALTIFEPASFDMVYIDASHDLPFIDDILASYPLVREGGWLAGHDYFPSGVNAVATIVDSMFDEPKIFSDTSWLVRRPDTIPSRPTQEVLDAWQQRHDERLAALAAPPPPPPPPPRPNPASPQHRSKNARA